MARTSRRAGYAGKHSYEGFVPAYRTAAAAFATHAGKKFEEIEDDLALGYKKHDPISALPWDEVRPAVQLAWDKLGGVITPRDRDRGIRTALLAAAVQRQQPQVRRPESRPLEVSAIRVSDTCAAIPF